MREMLDERRRERDELIARARRYVGRLCKHIEVIGASVAGSVARGDFNVWSDIDVVVVAEDLPDRTPDRMALLMEDAPSRLQPVGFTPEEFRAGFRKQNRLIHDALESGVALVGDLKTVLEDTEQKGLDS